MGACASFPKGLKGKDIINAPAPEHAKEESVNGVAVEEVKTEDKKNDDETQQHSSDSSPNEVC